jgi:hypothetical protein
MQGQEMKTFNGEICGPTIKKRKEKKRKKIMVAQLPFVSPRTKEKQ